MTESTETEKSPELSEFLQEELISDDRYTSEATKRTLIRWGCGTVMLVGTFLTMGLWR